MKIKESNFVEALSHRNERALEYVMVHYGGLVKSVVHRYLNVLSQYEEECMNDVFFAVWEHPRTQPAAYLRPTSSVHQKLHCQTRCWMHPQQHYSPLRSEP